MYNSDGSLYNSHHQQRAVFWRHADSIDTEPHGHGAATHQQRESRSPEYGGINAAVVAPRPIPAHLQTHPSQLTSTYPYRRTPSPDTQMTVYQRSGIPVSPPSLYYGTYAHNPPYNMTPTALHAATSATAGPPYEDSGPVRRVGARYHEQHHPYLSARVDSISPPHRTSSPALSRSASMTSISSAMTASAYTGADSCYLDQRSRAPPPAAPMWTSSAIEPAYNHTPRVITRRDDYPDIHSSQESPTELPLLAMLKRKKRSKMHACEVCHHEFPRPSGLRTHMNSHNNIRPYACTFPGCTKTFGVRSNAKRHLRTHGAFQPEMETGLSSGGDDQPYPDHVAYNREYFAGSGGASATAQPDMISRHAERPSAACDYDNRASTSGSSALARWMPASLLGCLNVSSLREATESSSSSDYEEVSDGYGSSSGSEASSIRSMQITMPLPSVVRSVTTNEMDDGYEERDSYISMPEYPYHPSQFRFLPGPSAQPLDQVVR